MPKLHFASLRDAAIATFGAVVGVSIVGVAGMFPNAIAVTSAPLFVAALGFAAAVGVPAWQRAQELQDRGLERHRKARALALTLRPVLEAWLERFIAREENVDRQFPPSPAEHLQIYAESALLKVPSFLVRKVDELYVLGWVGDCLIDAMTDAHEGIELAQAVHQRTLDPKGDQSAMNAIGVIHDRASAVETHVMLALDEIVELIGDSSGARYASLQSRRPF